MAKKEKKPISPYEEMDIHVKEVNELFGKVAQDYTKDIPKKEQLQEKDYLDDYDSEPTQNKNYSQPLMFNNEGKENLIADLLKVDWERV